MLTPLMTTCVRGGEKGKMTELLVMMAAAVCAFGLFLLVFLLKERSAEKDPARRPTCARCTCQQGLGHSEHLHSETEMTEKDIRI